MRSHTNIPASRLIVMRPRIIILKSRKYSLGMSRMNIEALTESMTARGYSSLATVIRDSFTNVTPNASEESMSTGLADEEIDIEALKGTVELEYHNRSKRAVNAVGIAWTPSKGPFMTLMKSFLPQGGGARIVGRPDKRGVYQ